MIKRKDKNEVRQKRHGRIRNKISGTPECPRMNVYRSISNIYVQFIDDTKGVTLASASTMEKEIAGKIKDMSKVEASKVVGEEAAKRALKAGIKDVVFDRGGYLYTGRVAALAEGAREAGLNF